MVIVRLSVAWVPGVLQIAIVPILPSHLEIQAMPTGQVEVLPLVGLGVVVTLAAGVARLVGLAAVIMEEALQPAG